MNPLIALALAGLAVTTVFTVAPQDPTAGQRPPAAIPNPQIDYPGFLELAQQTEALRASRRLEVAEFAQKMAEPGTVLLDARSADKYALRHVGGAVSLPFTDFTAEALAKVIPTKTTPVLIYCNNNFVNEPAAFPSKLPAASLNISTYIALATYGYTNVYELGPVLDGKGTALPFAGSAVAPLRR
jgi:rhodanese-related sulfurtransferase